MAQEYGFESIRPALERQKKDPSPLVRWTVGCIEEVYFGGDMAIARLRGPFKPDLKYAPLALRVIAVSGPEVRGVSVPFFPKSDEEAISYGQRLRDKIRQLPPTGASQETEMNFAQVVVSASGRQVLGALEIAQTREKADVVHVIYPKTYIRAMRDMFASLGRTLSDHDARTISYGLAIMFLKALRFTSEKPFILRRENIFNTKGEE